MPISRPKTRTSRTFRLDARPSTSPSAEQLGRVLHLSGHADLFAEAKDIEDRPDTPVRNRNRRLIASDQCRTTFGEPVGHRIGVERQGEREHHVRRALAEQQQVGRQAERPRSDERPGPVHARLDLVDQEQVAAAFPALVEVTDHASGTARTPPTDWISSTCTTANSWASKSASIRAAASGAKGST